MSGPAAPLRFLVAVVVLWTCGRTLGVALWPDPDDPASAYTPPPGTAMIVAGAAPRQPLVPNRPKQRSAMARPASLAEAVRQVTADASIQREADPGPRAFALPKTRQPLIEPEEPSAELRAIAALTRLPEAAPAASRWRGDAYMFLRDGSGPVLGPGGQLGGSQMFGRLSYDIRPGIAATVRLSRAVDSRDGEAAVGLALRAGRLPLTLFVERRIGVERGGRDAFALFAAGGLDAVRPVEGLRIDGYAQAGVVGARRRDFFADGAVRAGREWGLGAGSLTVGAGAWGGAQPGVSRVDVGPQAALRTSLGGAAIIVAADWRFRVAGSARPASGPALTIATGF